MIRNLIKNFRSACLLSFSISKARRDPRIPTQASFLRPFTINNLKINDHSRRFVKKVGRGPGSGKGKTSGRGMKGQKSRTGGGVHVRFEGGQTPISRRLPKYGRVKRKKQRQFFNVVNIRDIDYFIKKKILNQNQPITIKHLNDCGLVKKVKYGVKILGKGLERIDYPLHLEVSDASTKVIQGIESKGGSIKLIFRTKLKIQEHLYPQKFPLPLAEPLPPAWRVRKLARKILHRNHEIVYRKPKWKIDEEKQQELEKKDEKKFVYPVPRVSNPNRIRKRKVKLYKHVSYQLGS